MGEAALATGGGPLLEQRLVVAARPESLAAVHAALDRFWRTLAGRGIALPDELRVEFATAVGELTGNVVRHAYPTGPGQLRLNLRLHADAIEAVVADRGIEFGGRRTGRDLGAIDLLDLAEGGFGLDLARATVDRVDYSRARGVNRWRVLKRLPAGGPPSAPAREGRRPG